MASFKIPWAADVPIAPPLIKSDCHVASLLAMTCGRQTPKLVLSEVEGPAPLLKRNRQISSSHA